MAGKLLAGHIETNNEEIATWPPRNDRGLAVSGAENWRRSPVSSPSGGRGAVRPRVGQSASEAPRPSGNSTAGHSQRLCRALYPRMGVHLGVHRNTLLISDCTSDTCAILRIPHSSQSVRDIQVQPKNPQLLRICALSSERMRNVYGSNEANTPEVLPLLKRALFLRDRSPHPASCLKGQRLADSCRETSLDPLQVRSLDIFGARR